MAFSSTRVMMGSSSRGGAGKPTRSLSFTAASSQSLSMSSANFGSYNRAKWAVSFWVKLATINANQIIVCKGDSALGTTDFFITLLANNTINIQGYVSGGTSGNLKPTPGVADFDNTAIWYHVLFWYDSANSTSGDRMRLWINGSEITNFAVDVAPSGAVDASTKPIAWGVADVSGSPFNYFNGLIYQPAFFSGTLPTIGQVYNAGAALDVSGLTGLYSLLNTNNTTALEVDYVLTTHWTNNNTVIKSTTIP